MLRKCWHCILLVKINQTISIISAMPVRAGVGKVQICHKRIYFLALFFWGKVSYYSSITPAELRLQQEINRPWWLKCSPLRWSVFLKHISRCVFAKAHLSRNWFACFVGAFSTANKRRSVHPVKFSSATPVANDSVSLHYPALLFPPLACEEVFSDWDGRNLLTMERCPKKAYNNIGQELGIYSDIPWPTGGEQ